MNVPRAGRSSILILATLSALGVACGSEEAPPPLPPENPAAKWTVPAARESAPPPIPSAALAKPVMSEAERRAIAEARIQPPPGADAAAPAPAAAAEDPAPTGPGALSAEDLAALRDDPAAHALPDPAPIEAPAVAEADIPRAVLPPPESPAPAAVPPVTERVAAPDPEGAPAGTSGSDRRGVEISANSDANLSLLDLAVATAVVDREPEGATDRFDSTPPLLLCYSSFDQRNESATVTHVWTWNDREMARVELEVGKSPKWRTWSRQRLQPDQAGRWSCDVLGPDGSRLGIARVTVGR
jgi:hypothetical protein